MTNKSGVSTMEREMLDKVTALFSKLTEQEKERTIAFLEGMAFKADLSAAQEVPSG